jgi:hypothetical protein
MVQGSDRRQRARPGNAGDQLAGLGARVRVDVRLEDANRLDPARRDDSGLADAGGADLVLVKAGPVPLGHRHPADWGSPARS